MIINKHLGRVPRAQFWNIALPVIGSLVGGMLTNKSRSDVAEDTSQFNSAEAAISRDWSSNEAAISREFNSAQANRQMTFQQEMSNTAYQRTVKDMIGAGLNPMLAVSQGGASTPSGAAAASSTPGSSTASGVTPEVENVLGNVVATAQQARRVDQELSNMRATEELTRSQADVAKAQRDNLAQDTLNKQTQVDQIVATTENIKAATKKAGVDTEVSYQRVKQIIQDIEESRAREKNIDVDNILKNASVAEAKAIEQFYKSTLGEANPFVKLLAAAVAIFKR